MNIEQIKDRIRVVEGFPKKGISFKDITTLLADGEAFHQTIEQMMKDVHKLDFDAVIGPEARGFLFGTVIAYLSGVPFIPFRKPGKLPCEVLKTTYDSEYSNDCLECDIDAIRERSRFLIVDDLLATGGTVEAIMKVVEAQGAKVAGFEFVIELTDLKGRERLKGYPIGSVVQYDI